MNINDIQSITRHGSFISVRSLSANIRPLFRTFTSNDLFAAQPKNSSSLSAYVPLVRCRQCRWILSLKIVAQRSLVELRPPWLWTYHPSCWPATLKSLKILRSFPPHVSAGFGAYSLVQTMASTSVNLLQNNEALVPSTAKPY